MSEILDLQGRLTTQEGPFIAEFLVGFLSPHTRKAYKRDLTLFYFFLQEKSPLSTLKQATPLLLAVFREHLLKSYSARTVRRILDTLGSFYQFLVKKEVITRSPLENIDRPKSSREILTTDVSNHQVQEMLAAVDLKKNSGPLHRAVLSLFFYTGLRSEEVRKLKVENLQLIKDQFALVFRGKGDKERIVPVPPPLQKDLARYFKWRKHKGESFAPVDPLLCSSQAGKSPLAARTISYIVKSYAQKVGITSQISVHSTRATFIGASLEAGIPLDRVAQLVGHADVNLTRRYSKRRDVLKTFEKLPDLYRPEEGRE